MPRVVRSRSAEGVTMAALLPPSSRSERPNRSATRGPTARPIRVDPVALSRAIPRESTNACPTSAPPRTTELRPAGAPSSAIARSSSAAEARADSGASSEGFHTTGSPQTSASAVFQDQTATGKLKALITPTTPSGCQDSISRCPGRSELIVLPYSCRERPTANSQMSIISWTSPSASERILPTSRLTSVPRSSLCCRSSSPKRRTSPPRTGAGTVRHSRKASWARSTAPATSAASCQRAENSGSPLIGEVTGRSPADELRSTPQRPAASWAERRRSSAVGRVVTCGSLGSGSW